MVSRRNVLKIGLLVGPLVYAPGLARAQDSPASVVQTFSNALLGAMQAGRAGFTQRFNMLAPAVDHAFDLDTILQSSVGLQWAATQPAQQNALRAAFRRYTIASFASNFDSYAGQSFQVNPEPRSLPNGDQIITSKILKPGGGSNTLAYVMRRQPTGWKIVDVLADGSISRVATQRSDFRGLLSSGGTPALVSSLQTKTANMSGGAPV